MAKAAKPKTQPEGRRNGVRDIGALLPDVAGTAFRRFGFSQTLLVSRWGEIVGPAYARSSAPQSLRFSRGQPGGGVLTVRAEGAVALQLQHIAPQLIERVNRMLGGTVVGRLRLLQGEVAGKARPPAPNATPAGWTATANLAAPLAGALAAVRDDGLRQALLDLAAQLQAGSLPPPTS